MSNIIDLDYEREKRLMLAKAEEIGLSLGSADGGLLEKWRAAAAEYYEQNIKRLDD